MKKKIYYALIGSVILSICLVGLSSCNQKKVDSSLQTNIVTVTDTIKQKAALEKLLSLLTPDVTVQGRVSFYDATFQDWIKRTGELPPDFDKMPSIPFLPDPLVLDEGRKNIPIKSMEQWKEKREWMRKELEYYIGLWETNLPE